MPIEEPTIEKEKIEERMQPREEEIGPEAIEIKEPVIETEIQPEKEITAEQMQQDKQETVDGLITKFGRVSRKVKTLIVMSSLATIFAAGPIKERIGLPSKKAEAKELTESIPTIVKAAIYIFARSFGILKTAEEKRAMEQMERLVIDLINQNQEDARNYAHLRISQARDKQFFNQEKHSTEEKLKLNKHQEDERENVLNRHTQVINDRISKLRELKAKEKDIEELKGLLRKDWSKVEIDTMAERLSKLAKEKVDIIELIKILNISLAELQESPYFQILELKELPEKKSQMPELEKKQKSPEKKLEQGFRPPPSKEKDLAKSKYPEIKWGKSQYFQPGQHLKFIPRSQI